MAGNHACCLFSDEIALQRAIAVYIERAIRVNARVCCVTLDTDLCAELVRQSPDFRPIDRDALVSLLKGVDVPVDDLVAKGQLVLLGTRGVYIRDGPFDADAVTNSFRAKYEESIAQGYSGLFGIGSCCFSVSWFFFFFWCFTQNKTKKKKIGDMTWAALAQAQDVKRVHEYECKITDLHAECPNLLGFCFYDERVLPPAFLRKVLTTHPQAIVNDELFANNFYYIPPQEFLGDNPKRAALNHWVQNLRDRRALDETVASKTVALHLNNVQLQRELEDNARLQHEKKLAELANQQKSAFVAMLYVCTNDISLVVSPSDVPLLRLPCQFARDPHPTARHPYRVHSARVGEATLR